MAYTRSGVALNDPPPAEWTGITVLTK